MFFVPKTHVIHTHKGKTYQVLKGCRSKKSRIVGFALQKLKIFNRSKEKKDTSTVIEARTEPFGESEENSKIPEIREESEEIPIKEYNETLYSKGYIQKKPTTIPSERKQSWKRFSWENLVTIEHNVDTIECKETEVSETRIQASDDIDQKVDRTLIKKKVC